MSYWRLYYHLVWATTNREPLIQPAIESQLHALLMHKAGELGVWIYAVNGWYDHVHLVVAIPPKHAVATVVKHLKGDSSHALNHAGLNLSFGWQQGYGALTVGERHRPEAEAYVRSQKQHHSEGKIIGALEYDTELDEGPDDQCGSESVIQEAPVSCGVGTGASWLGDDWPPTRLAL
jgi:putative transposase